MLVVSVARTIFDEFPGYRCGLIVGEDLQTCSDRESLDGLFRDAAARARRSAGAGADPRITRWTEAYGRFGSDPSARPPHLALLERYSRPASPAPPPGAVATIVAFHSLRHLAPIVAEAPFRMGDEVVLRRATGAEGFAAWGRGEWLVDPARQVAERPAPGEVVWVFPRTGEVLCRNWNERSSVRASVDDAARRVLIRVEALGDGSDEDVLRVRDETADMLQSFCKAGVRRALLSPSSPSHRFAD